MIKERLCKLREAMKEKDIDCYLMPSSDTHDSEYISDFFKVRQYFSGFTGSAGTLIVTAKEAALFTDGRYFIQAEKELSGTEILLMKMGEPGVPTIKEYLEQNLSKGQNLGFDGKVVNAGQALTYKKLIEEKQGRMIWEYDLAEAVWRDRPGLVHHPVSVLTQQYSGESVDSKIARLREKMKEITADIHLLTTLDDIAWLLNIRGSDVENSPVVLAYASISRDEVLLFAGERERYEDRTAEGQAGQAGRKADAQVFSAEVRAYLRENNITLLPYEDFYSYAGKLQDKKILLSRERINCYLDQTLGDKVTIIDRENPTMLMKAVKNQVEMMNLRNAHVKDAVAVTRFMYWLKKNVGKIPMTEVSASAVLENFRKEQEHFIEPSFETICAYGSNGAIIHYSAQPECCARIENNGLLMVDSGGHYLEGSTDITRTFVLGEVPAKMKYHYTLVLRAMLNLKHTCFLYGCRGINLDIRAREVLWEVGLDYKHGTGHGVGYLLNVHEGPNSFRWKNVGEKLESAVLEEGMVTTDEPGIYIEGSHGIRIENELLCRKGGQNEYGQFMYFEDLTYVPIDLDGVEADLLEDKDIQRLNDYHREVYEKLSPYFEGEELKWLKNATRAV